MLIEVIVLVAMAGVAIAAAGTGMAALLPDWGRDEQALIENRPWQQVMGIAIAMLLLLNGNLWVTGGMAWAGLAVSAVVLQITLLVRDRGRFLRELPLLAAVGVTCMVLATVWLKLFAANGTWFLQGDGNDMVYFFAGGAWAAGHPLMVPQELVASTFGLGDCRAGVMLVGQGCAVTRTGSYTLMSLLPQALEGLSPNAARAALGLSGVPLVAGLLPLLWQRLRWQRATLAGDAWTWCVVVAAALLVGLCTGIVGSVANGNVGTALGNAPLAMLALLAFSKPASAPLKAVVLGLGCASATHLYGEALVYACVVVAAGVVADAVRFRRPLWIVSGGLLSILVLALSTNLLLREVYHSLVSIGQIVQHSEWRAWYLTAPAPNWLAAPFTGIQMDGERLVSPFHLALGLVLASITAVLSVRRDRWAPSLVLVAFSCALVVYLERTGYQYGEHKVVQMLGAIWSAALVAMALESMGRSATPPRGLQVQQSALASIALLVAAVLSIGFMIDASKALRLRAADRALPRGFADALERVAKGDEVVIDQSAVFNIARYIKQDYITIGTQLRGGEARLTVRQDGSIPPHSESVRRDTFRASSSPDWLVRLSDATHASVFNPQLPAVARVEGAYDLVDLRDGAVAIALSGDGWHACEADHCWSSGPYSIEAWVPAGCRGATLHVAQNFHAAPAGHVIETTVNDASPVLHAGPSAAQLAIALAPGWSRISVAPRWAIVSPQSLGASADPRPLFAAVTKALVQCEDPATGSDQAPR